MTETSATVTISYSPAKLAGRLTLTKSSSDSSIWERIRTRVISDPETVFVAETIVELPWSSVLDIVREYGSRAEQISLNFRFVPDETAKDQIARFAADVRAAKSARSTLKATLSIDEIKEALLTKGFTRELKPFQLRDLQHLLSLPNGANFSVPGAGKTSVAFALHVLTRQPGQKLLVVAPKAAFPAWAEVVTDCMALDAPNGGAEPFTVLDGRDTATDRALRSNRTRFIISYDLMVRQQGVISAYLAQNPVHLILDEAHRMKAGALSQRGAFLISVANLPARKDILTGTPMPQSAADLVSQLQFLWPGHGYDLQIQQGTSPRDVLGNLYVRTTKSELGLPQAYRHHHQVEMAPGQLAVYSMARNEALRQLTRTISSAADGMDLIKARRSVMRLLQLSSNPVLALQSMSASGTSIDTKLAEAVIDEGPSLKMRAVVNHARLLAQQGKKTVIWTIFTQSIFDLEALLADLNPVSLFGQIPSGSVDDQNTREGRLKRFHIDPRCRVMIANPAAAGEGISLHTVCHDAIYLDRSYVSTHFLQSIDRIHRLGLDPDVETNIHIYETRAPQGVGSIDFSVRRRLITKIGELQRLLDDPDLKEIELDEINADDPTDYNVDLQDLVDLVAELEGRAADEPAD